MGGELAYLYFIGNKGGTSRSRPKKGREKRSREAAPARPRDGGRSPSRLCIEEARYDPSKEEYFAERCEKK